MIDLLERREMEQVAVILWPIWYQRNLRLHEGMTMDPLHTANAAAAYLHEYRNTITFAMSQDHIVFPQNWLLLPIDWIKVNLEGAIFSELEALGVGLSFEIMKTNLLSNVQIVSWC
ncbi:hypothetical protein ACH5RR_008222 [Cinchona calisaya]|uniref:Uncharacterized protein n=1 Tax=Cinchona calisaya TaxID=153742 RepID=A0ABD3AEL5_9GENT